jgi:integrase/recombinase XerD
MLVLPKAKTKGKLASRSIPVHPTLAMLLQQYGPPQGEYLFPGRHGRGHLHPASASQVIQDCLTLAGLCGLGITTHSFRRTALTKLSNAGVPLRVIQQISGHKSLASLQLYLQVTPDQVESAVLAAFG